MKVACFDFAFHQYQSAVTLFRSLQVALLVTLILTSGCGNPPEPYDGVTLFAPLHSTKTELRNNDHEVIHSWTSKYPPGQCVYLMPDGSLLRTARLKNDAFDVTYGKGSGGRVEWLEWDGSTRWEFTLSTDDQLLHHDIEPMPNGNLLMMVWVRIPDEAVIAAGRRLIPNQPDLLSERIIEVDPRSDEIVWQWDAWDHLIQNVNSDLPNFGKPSGQPGKIDVNTQRDAHDWLHFNGISYSEEKDLIAISCRQTSEVWLIDHGTTTEQAKTSSGGRRGVGGDLFARWGNRDGKRILFNQHNANWIPEGRPGAGNLLLFNNGTKQIREFSDVLEVHFDEDDRTFDIVWIYSSEQKENLFSEYVSGAQRLPNGNTLICSGCQGWTFEVDSNGKLAWEHTYPVHDREDWIFRVEKYPWRHIPEDQRLSSQN